MPDVYEACPTYENERFLLRFVEQDDCADLLKVYSDENAVPLFNGDNCHGDDFHYTTAQRMRQAIDFWIVSYENRYFVRWSVVDKSNDTVIGTIELFNRIAEDHFNNCGLLRLDLRSDHEYQQDITDILNLILPHTADMFGCVSIATKAVPMAEERIAALRTLGFSLSEYTLKGNDGTEYDNYYIRY